MSRYLIIIEATSTGYSAYSPDLPGCATTGRTREEVEHETHDAIEFHIEGLRLAGAQVPELRSQASYCEVAAKPSPEPMTAGADAPGSSHASGAAKSALVATSC